MKRLIIISVAIVLCLALNMSVFADDVDMRLYIKKDATESDQQMYHGVKYEPKVGAYLGMYAEGDKVVHDPMTGNPFYFDAVPKLTGKKHATYMIYIQYKNMEFNHYASHYRKAKQTGCAMQVALEPLDGLHEVVDDAYLHRLARQAKETEIPIFLRFANEMNDPGSAWGQDKALYIEKFRLVADVMHKEAPNVVMCWSPNDWGHHGFGDAVEWYPGDQYVDWVGISSYAPYLINGESKHHTKFTDRLATIYNAYADRKPIYLSEGAPIQNIEFKTTDVSQVAAKDLREFYDEIARRYPAIKAVFYWDNDEQVGAKRQCKLSDNLLMLKTYKASIADDYFLSNVGDNSAVIYVDLAQQGIKPIKAAVQDISCFVGNHSLKTNKVVYYINDQYVSETVGSPYTALIDFAPYAGQKIRLSAQSYDTADTLIKTVEYSVDVAAIPFVKKSDVNISNFWDRTFTHHQ